MIQVRNLDSIRQIILSDLAKGELNVKDFWDIHLWSLYS